MGMVIYQIHLLYQLVFLLHSLLTLLIHIAFIYLFTPAGSILVDNRNIQNIRLQSLRRHVGVVSQDIVSVSCLHILLFYACRYLLKFMVPQEYKICLEAGIFFRFFYKLLGTVWHVSEQV